MVKISIITVVYNGEDTIQDCIESVLKQEYSNREYIIVDGCSQDGTLKVVNSYAGKIDKIISEPDDGIYDAMNKGIQVSTGDIVAILNADDFYASTYTLSMVAKEFSQDDSLGCVFGDLHYVNRDQPEKVRRIWKSSSYRPGLFQSGWHPPHPSFFVKKSVYDTYGLFRTDLPVAADYELMLRFIEKYGIKTSHIPHVLVKMRLGGNSTKSLKNIIQGNLESLRSWKINGLKAPPLFLLKKPLRKTKQIVWGHLD